MATTNSGLTIEGAVAGHTYKVYQIFKGDVSSDGAKLSNVMNGANYTSEDLAADLAVLEADGADAKEFAKGIRDKITGEPAAVLTKENSSAELEAGYYLVMDESDGTAANDAISDYIVSVIGNVIVKPKAVTVPGFDKSIDEDAAAETPKKQTTLTVTNPEDGYTYKVYQIFTGDVEDGKLVNAGYGANYEGSGNIGNDVDTFNNAADKKEYAVSIKDAIKGKESPVTTLNKGNPSTTVDGGFYVIIVEDEDGNEAADGAVADGENPDTSIDPEEPDPGVILPNGAMVAPQPVGTNWDYTRNGDGTITLNYYKGSDANVTVYGYYKIDEGNRVYKALLKSNADYIPYKGSYMFYNTNVSSVTFSDDLDTSTCTGMAYMFANCANLVSVDFGGNFDTSNVTSMSNMFYMYNNNGATKPENSSLTHLDLSCFDTSKVTDMSFMFGNCYKLTNLDLGNFDTSNVTNMTYMFEWCMGLTDLDVSNFKTSNVAFMGGMFAGCMGLTHLDLSNFDTGNVTQMWDMFQGFPILDYDTWTYKYMALESLDLSNFDTSNVTDMSRMFSGCGNLTTLNISNFDTSNVTSMSNMFADCQSLTDLDLSHFKTSKVTTMSYMFYGCTNLASLNLHNFNTGNVAGMNYMFSGCETLAALDLRYFDTSNVKTMEEMFEDCKSVVSLDLSNFNTSKVTNMNEMFHSCEKLTDLDLSSFNTANVIDMGGMFQECKVITSLDLSNFNTGNVTTMVDTRSSYGGMFEGCSKLTDLDLSSFDTKNVSKMDYLFMGCHSLTDLDLSGFDTSGVISMQRMFWFDNSLTNLNLSSFDTSNVTNMSEMFTVCSCLTNLDLSSFNTSSVTNMHDMFASCECLKDIMTGEGWTTSAVTDSRNMFSRCNNLSDDRKKELLPSWTASIITPLSLLIRSFASESGITTPDAIEIKGDDKTVDYAVGDHVPFKLEATMPESISAYEKYKLVFHDEITGGMSYDQDSLKVYADGVKITDASAYAVEWGADGKTLTVTMNDVKAAPYNAAAGTKITVKYTTTLLEEGADGAANEASLDYSNDPNGEGMGTTGGSPDNGDPDVVEVITFSVKFDKVDKNGEALPGAGFTLYRKGDDGEFAELETIAGTTAFDFDGLKPGDYKLVESTTPDGYNTMEDLLFSIVADKTTGDDGVPVITVKIVGTDGTALENWTADAAAKAFESDITNYSGSTLPSTGGIGTYLFYIAGAGLVILIGAVMVTRKENKENE